MVIWRGGERVGEEEEEEEEEEGDGEGDGGLWSDEVESAFASV